MASNQTYEGTMKWGGHPETLVITLSGSKQRSSLGHCGPSGSKQRSSLGHCGPSGSKQRSSLGHCGPSGSKQRSSLGHCGPSGTKQRSSLGHCGPSGTTQGEDEEVPMETNQLEEALMMSTPVVKEALHLIAQKVRAKILSDGDGYADVRELLKDLNL